MSGWSGERAPTVVVWILGLLMTVGGLAVVPAVAGSASAADPCAVGANPVVCENSKPGADPAEWDIDGAGSASIQGFSTDISVDVGHRIDFKIDTDASAYTIGIYRVGYYQGEGARRIASVTPSATLPQHQPECITDPANELVDCGNWAVSASWNVPADAVSGVYLAVLQRSNGDRSHITFVVRDDASHSDVLFQTSDPTWQAYNTYGGSDFYVGGAHGRAYKLSYNRPVLTRGDNGGRDFFFSAEYPMVRFLEKNGYDVSYLAGVDTDRRGQVLTQHKVFLSVGHDEYWSGAQRANVEAARDAGVHLQFLSGNEVYWRTRYEDSLDSSHTPYRTLVSYKETWGNTKMDPSAEWTGTWRDPRFAPRSQGGGRPENGLTGTAYVSNFSDLPVTVSTAEGRLRLWRGTSLASLPAGQSVPLAPSTIGYESNEDLDNADRPAGLIRLSTTVGDVPQVLQDFGNTTAPGTTTHHLTMYRAASGALVFSAGTIQWSWGLDAEHDRVGPAADVRMQQAQVNLFADMGVQPGSLSGGLSAATRSTDTTAPSVAIDTPAAGVVRPNGQTTTVTGTATDVGGRVAGVEVSTDGGTTWHAAEGTGTWSYSFIQRGVGPASVRARATDDSLNTGAVVSRAYAATCPCSILGTATPKRPATEDGSAVELGLRFTAAGDGFVTGVRFYKGPGNTGTHTGSLWSAAGARLAQVAFTGESAQGWQQATFATPVAVSAGDELVVSYTAPSGHYAAQPDAFAAEPLDAGALYVDGGFGSRAAGVFGVPGSFPQQSWQNTNYYVDVTFDTQDASPLIASGHWPAPGSSSVDPATRVQARFSKPVVPGSAEIVLKDALGSRVPGATTYDATARTVTFVPTSPLANFVTHTATVSGTDAQGSQVGAGATWSFRTARAPGVPGVCPCTLFDESLTPTVPEASDASPITLGVRITPSASGRITGVRFYKAPGNTGTHTGTLYSATGAVLATGTFTGESTSGWQSLEFATPVTVTAGSTYVAAYHSPTGTFSMTPNAFLTDLSRGPLRVSSQAGAYAYGTGFPANGSSSNYLVDAVFEAPAPSLAITRQSPAPGAVDVLRGSDVVVDLSAPLAPGWTMTLAAGTTPVSGAASLSADGTRLRFDPTDRLPENTLITVRLAGLRSVEGVTLPATEWTFRTAVGDDIGAPQSLFGDDVPATAAADDAATVELGTAFTPAVDGSVTAVRFFKGPGNAGTHTGSVWSAEGVRLATVTFTGESAAGWQEAQLAQPLPVEGGRTYVVSYLAPQGHYAVSPGFFSSPRTSGDLTAPAQANGRYVYGGGFPAYSWNATNYFVDVVFRRTAPTIAVTATDPAPGASEVPTSSAVTVTLSAPVADGWSLSLSRGGTPVAGTSTRSADGRTLTFTPTGVLPAGTELSAQLSGVVSTRGAVLPARTWTFTTRAESTATATLLGSSTPAAVAGDSADVEVGMAFTTTVDARVTAIRFHKSAGNTGTHTGSVWSADGTRLAQVTFTGESASGWQRAVLATPLRIVPGQTYVVSYYAPNGHFSYTPAAFTDPVASGPLRAVTGANGRYRYGWGGGFPTSSWNSTNYFVDVEVEYPPG